MEQGILGGTGEMIVYEDGNGNKKEIEMPEPIHTYQKWQELGYQVRKDEKAIAKFPVWKYTNKKKKEESEEEAQSKGYCFMKMSAFFTNEQVEEIKEV